MPRFIDTHVHYFDRRFHELEGGVDALLCSRDFRTVTHAVINVGTSPRTNMLAVEQAARYPFMVAAVGIHPEDAQGLPDGEALDPTDELCGLLSYLCDPLAREEDKIVAIGEIGLDYHWEPMDKDLQKAFFDGQMEIARKTGLPVIIHDREAHGDCFDTILRYPSVTGVFHAYSGSSEMARELVRRGWYIGLGGTLTFKNAEDYDKLSQDDLLEISGVYAGMDSGEMTLINKNNGDAIALCADFTERQKAILKAGGLLAYTKELGEN